MTVSRDPGAPAVLALGRDAGVLLMNAYTGEVIANGSSARGFFRTVTDWHRWLGRSGEARAAGRAVTGAANLAFLCLVLSGMYIWLPRMWTWRQVRGSMWFRRGAREGARLQLASRLRVLGGGSARHRRRFRRRDVVLVGERARVSRVRRGAASGLSRTTPQQTRAAAPGPEGGSDVKPLALDGLDTVWARAEGVDGWQTLALRVPSARDRQVIVTVDRGTGGQPTARQLTFDRATGAIVSSEPFQSLSAGRRVRSILRFAHTGEVLGLAGQTIAGAASFGAVMLVY